MDALQVDYDAMGRVLGHRPAGSTIGTTGIKSPPWQAWAVDARVVSEGPLVVGTQYFGPVCEGAPRIDIISFSTEKMGGRDGRASVPSAHPKRNL